MALAGLALITWSAWIPAKALLAQELLAQAWQQTLLGEERVRPWPWADTWPVARLRTTDGQSLYVLAGASGASMSFGPGHVSTSAPPGAADNVALAGHRDTHFAFLEYLKPGDVLTLETASTPTRYVVESAEIVHESRVDVLERTGRAELTLITCFPFDAVVPGGPLRFVVHAAASHSEIAEVTGALPPRGSRTISRIAPSWALVLRSWNRSRGKSCLAQIIGTQIPIGTPRTNNKR